MTFLTAEKNRQSEWKLNTKDLSRGAKKAGYYRGKLYPWALPVDFAGENLHTSIREDALAYFKHNRISWHIPAYIDGPTNHLVSSQICCLNFLYPFIHEPEELKSLVQPLFPDVQKILPIEKADQYIAFEWIGDHNYLNEEPKLGTVRHRGLGNTSIDYAFLMKTNQNTVRMVLGEWKYVESYSRTNIRFRSDRSDRLETYKGFLSDPQCPILIDQLQSLDLLFYEPVYQASRHLLMGAEILKMHPEIDQVVNLHLRSRRNKAILRRPTGNLPEAASVYDSIRTLLREPESLMDYPFEDLFDEYYRNGKDRIGDYLKSRYKF